MSLGVIPIFWFEFLSDFLEKIAKRSKMGNWVKSGLRRSKGHLCLGEAERPKRPPLSFASAKSLFTRAKIFILFSKASYSSTDSLGTLINY